MPILEYNGKVSITIYNNEVPPTTDLRIFSLSQFINLPIIWNSGQDIPNDLIGKSLNTLPKGRDVYYDYILEYTLNLIITGRQYYDNSSYPTTYVNILTPTGSFDKIYEPPSSGSLGTATYNVNQIFPLISVPAQLETRVYNRCYDRLPGCSQFKPTGYTMILTLNITIFIPCEGENLSNPVCISYCGTPANRDICFTDVINYCLPSNIPSIDMPIGYNGNCQAYISNYIQNVTPRQEIDTGLIRYCTGKYRGFGDLFNNNPNTTDIAICACHMGPEQYENYANELYTQYPGFKNLGTNQYCLLPQCATSQYKNLATGKVCAIPQCINVVSFNNNGTFDNSGVTINQSGECAQITNSEGGGGGNGTPPPPPNPNPVISFFDKYKTIIIIIGVSIVVIIIIIIIIAIVASSRSKNKNT